MSALRLAGWLLPAQLRRHRAGITLSALCVALLAALLPALSASNAAPRHTAPGAVVRTIAIGTGGHGSSLTPLTAQSLASIADLPHVDAVTPWARTPVRVITSGTHSAQTEVETVFMTRVPSVQPKLVAGSEPSDTDEVALPATFAQHQNIRAGGSLSIEYTRIDAGGARRTIDLPMTVTGIFDDGAGGVGGTGVAYASPAAMTSLVAQTLGRNAAWITSDYAFPKAYVTVDDVANVATTLRAIQSRGFNAASFAALLGADSPDTKGRPQGIAPLAVLIAVLVLVGIAWTTIAPELARRRGSAGVLRSAGWHPSDIVVGFELPVVALGLVAGAIGIAAGAIALIALRIFAMGSTVLGVRLTPELTSRDMLALAAVAALPMLAFVVASLPALVRLGRTPASEALRH